MLTTRFVDGSPNWLDLGTPHLDAAVSFYSGLFGWQFQTGGPEVGGYGLFQLDGKSVAERYDGHGRPGPAVLDRLFPDAGRGRDREGR